MLRHLSLNLSLKSTAQYLELAKKKSILTELDGGKKKRRNGVSTEILEVLKPSLKATVDTERKTEQHAVGREQGEQSLIIRHLQMKGSKVDFHHMDTREVTCLKKNRFDYIVMLVQNTSRTVSKTASNFYLCSRLDSYSNMS